MQKVTSPKHLEIHKKHDFDLNSEERKEILDLLSKAFPGYFKDRIFFKQMPTYRFLVKDNQKIIAQAGIDCRVVKSGKFGILNILGIIDMCVDPIHQHKGIANYLLNSIEEQAKTILVDYIFLFADDRRLYQKNGYVPLNATCRFLAIDELTSLFILEKNMSDCMTIKAINGSPTLDLEHIDMLGYLY